MVTVLPMESPYTARMAEAVKALAEASVSASPDGVEAALAAIEHRVADFESRRDPPFGDTVAVFCATVGPAATAEATRSHFRSCVRSPSCTPTESPTTQTGRLAESIPRICSCQPRWITYVQERVAARGMNAQTSSPHAGHVTVARPTSPSRNLVGVCSMRRMSVAIGTDSPGCIRRS